MLRDYVEYWYKAMADDDTFLIETKRLIQVMLVELSVRYGSSKMGGLSLGVTCSMLRVGARQLV
jgi:hypothetical protein